MMWGRVSQTPVHFSLGVVGQIHQSTICKGANVFTILQRGLSLSVTRPLSLASWRGNPYWQAWQVSRHVAMLHARQEAGRALMYRSMLWLAWADPCTKIVTQDGADGRDVCALILRPLQMATAMASEVQPAPAVSKSSGLLPEIHRSIQASTVTWSQRCCR